MSNVSLPFLFKCNLTRGHVVNNIHSYIGENKFATGSAKGDLIIWKLNKDIFEPIIFMTASLN